MKPSRSVPGTASVVAGRRHFLAATTLTVAGAVLGRRGLAASPLTAPPVAGTLVVDKGFATVFRVAEGVYATIARPERGPQALSNGGLIVGRDGVLIVEGHYDPSGAAVELEVARERSRAPIRAAVNSNYHFDHTLGNSRYAAEKIPIIGHELTRAKMQQIYGSMKRQSAEKLLDDFKRTLGEARTDAERARAAADVEAYTLLVKGVLGATLTYPTEPVSARREIDLGGLTVILEPQPGHTPTDLLITVPERGVVFTGDLLVNGLYPVTVDADLAAWRAALVKLSRMPADTVLVPGHGPVAGREAVTRQLDLFDHVAQYSEDMFRAGVPLTDAQQRYEVPARFASLAISSWAFSIPPAIRKHYAAHVLARGAAAGRN
jgi:glyoxylase-like metal-dependent hydrolase (beta-lactamase superfamily II)